ERKLHKIFARHHLRGEWFVLCDEIVDYIEAHCRPCPFGIKRIGVMPPESSDPAKDKPFLSLMFTATVPALLYTSGRVALLHDLFDPASTFGSLALDVVALSVTARVPLIAALYPRLLWLIVRNCLADYRYRRTVK